MAVVELGQPHSLHSKMLGAGGGGRVAGAKLLDYPDH